MFIVRGAGGYAGGHAWRKGDQETVGWAICGDSVLTAWLSEGTNEANIAHEVIFVDDTWGRHEWEIGWERGDIEWPLEYTEWVEDGIGYSRQGRLYFGTPNAQTGSFIHESFHAIFNAIHVGPEEIAALRAKNPNDPRIVAWEADPVDNIMGGSHLDWDGSHGEDGAKAKIHEITLNEMEDVDAWI